MTSTCATCPLSLQCFSGHLEARSVGLCFHCGSVVMFVGAALNVTMLTGQTITRRHEIDTHRCHNPLQFLDAVQYPVSYFKDSSLFGVPQLMPIRFDPPLMWPDVSEIAVICTACREAHQQEERRQRPRLILPRRLSQPLPWPLVLTPTGAK